MTEPLPDPLVPPDVDLRGLPWMPLDTVRLLDSDLFAMASGDAFKAAVSLWCRAWRQVPASSLPTNEKILADWSGARGKWSRVRDVAMRGFVLCSDGRYYHGVIAERALESWKRRLTQREKAEKRWGRSGISPADAAASPTAMQGIGEDKKGEKRESKSKARAAPRRSEFDVPRWIQPEAWRGFEEMRNRIKKPMTDRARNLIVKQLLRLHGEGHDPNDVLDQSTRKSWQDVYPIKPDGGVPRGSEVESLNRDAADLFAKGKRE